MGLASELVATVGDAGVSFTYRLTNEGEGPIDLQFSSGQRIDVSVSTLADRQPVWRASEDRMYAMAIGFVHLDAGEVVTFDEFWRDPIPGQYHAEGVLAAASVDAPATTTFEVA